MSRQQVTVRDELNLPAIVFKGGVTFVKTYPKISISYVVGVIVCLLGSGITPSPDAVLNMERAVSIVENNVGVHLVQASERFDHSPFVIIQTQDIFRLMRAEQRYHASQGMFWTCDQNCQHNRLDYEASLAEHSVRQHNYSTAYDSFFYLALARGV